MAQKLAAAGIPYMVVGSFASSLHGVPRTTQDLDIVIDPNEFALRTLVQSLPELEYYVDLNAALDALRRRTLFNVIDMETGWKVDLVIRKARSFSVEELKRRTAVALLGADTFVSTPEDTIIAKLEWAKVGCSEMQLRDAAGIIEVRGSGLDTEYVEHWTAALNLQEQWLKAQELARPKRVWPHEPE
jgi:hypothetical protein